MELQRVVGRDCTGADGAGPPQSLTPLVDERCGAAGVDGAEIAGSGFVQLRRQRAHRELHRRGCADAGGGLLCAPATQRIQTA